MKVIQKNAKQMPKVVEIDGSLESMQKIVNGHIEVFPLDGDIVIVLNEEGKLKNLPVNFMVKCSPSYTEIIVGDVFICKANGEDLIGLNDDEIKYFMRVFTNWEKGVN